MNSHTIVSNMRDLIIAQHLHYLMIAIFLSLGIYLWDREKSLFSFSWKRFFSYFFLILSFDQIVGGFFSSWIDGMEKRVGIFHALGALMNPVVFNEETFAKCYPSFFGIVFWSRFFVIFTTSISSSLGFALWNPKLRLNKFSLKRVFSLLFFVMVGTHFTCQINSFFYKLMCVSLELYH